MSQDNFDEKQAVEEVKQYFLDHCKTTTSQDALNFAASYKCVVDAERIKAETDKCR